ncbi:MAG: lipopolysaccharide heptosyltransferase II [Omnitrophica bacterium RIFCSPHIGHO2_02_FULL_51_18]|nr:MAG: lipopolysaccharide heptosyltransferase II [Omnitrophica bacterium RIFCSPHIGHO2_02_FULL_51_18]
MNVLQILPELNSGGVERGTVDLAKFLREKGHKSVVVSAGGPLVGDLTSAGVLHYALPVHKKTPFAILRSVNTLAKIVKREHIDVLHARSRVPALVAYLVSRKTQVPFITTCHGFYSKHFLSALMGWGKLTIVASHVIGRRMRDDFGVPHNKIRLIHRGVNLNEFKRKEAGDPVGKKESVIGIVGRLTPIKGHPLFLKAMARVTRVLPPLKIQIIGDAPKPQYKEELKALVRRLGLSHAVEFLGTRYDIPELLSKMSVLVVPSTGEEAFGRVVIEAGACGVPVVATRIGGLVDIIQDEKDGLLVPPDDPKILADAVIRILKDPALADRLASSLRRKVEKEFNLDLMFQKTLEAYQEAVSRQKILVIKLSAVGDVILSIPSIRALKTKFPDAWISVLVGRKSRKIVRNCPYVDDAIVYEETPGKNRLLNILKTARLLAKENFDIVVDLQNNRTSHALSFLCGARTRAGQNNRKWSFLLNKKTTDASSAGVSPLEHQFKVLRLLGIGSFDKRLELWADEEEQAHVREFMASQWVAPSQVLVGINPGSSLRWPTKQWGVENFARLCDELAKRNIRVVVTGTPEDIPLTNELFRLTKHKPIHAVGRTSISELIALVRRCQVFVSSDSAPMHVAASVDVPLVAIFGPTDPKRHLVPPSRYQVFWKEVHCSPCYLRNCPIGLICMKKIGVQEVLDAVCHFVETARPAAQAPVPQSLV